MHPVLLSIGGFKIYSYGAMLVISFFFATAIAIWQGKRRGYSGDAVVDLVMNCILSGIVGCRIGFIIQYPAAYFGRPWSLSWPPNFNAPPLSMINLREGGMTITGGVVIAALWLAWYYRKSGSVLNIYDFMAAPVLVGMAVGRVGCLLHGCCYGAPCDLPWAITFPAEAIPEVVPRHPSQIYEMLMDLMLLPVLLWQLPRVKFAGQNFYTFFMGYGIIRFLDETTRYIDVWWGPLGMYEWISVGFFFFGLAGRLGLFGKPDVNTKILPEEPV